MSDLDPTLSDAPRLDQDAPALQQIGPYRVLELLGSGGFGEVYKAERRVPMRQTVAIKVIKLGFDTREIIARFNSERQALARMDHPNVAKVLDAGTTDNGRPYFVMEYVPGEPITQFCDIKKLSIKDRLELFTQACEAINHAHTKAIIHRDIKAGNVLAYLHDNKPVVKVIDFGIAKALTGDKLTEQTFNTERGQIIGTYETMSPEQAEGSPDIDTRTDVYSLGVLLYELLSGVKPFDSETLRKAADAEIKRIIREVEPPRPSTKLSGLGEEATKIASARREDLSALSKRLHSELEWIPLKAIRKERDRRYASPLQLAEDIQNYLEGKPLLAGPESRAYRVRKFARRNWHGLVAAAAIALLLVGGIIATSWQAVRATRAEARALQEQKQATDERDNAKATLEFLTEDVLSGATPENIPDAKVREQIVDAMITPAAKRVGEAFKDRPLIEASIRSAIQTVLDEIGRSDLALPHAEAALAIRRRELGEDHPETLRSLNEYALMLQSLGRPAEAEPLHKQALERRRRVLGEDHPDTITSLNNYAGVLQSLGRWAEAEPLSRQALTHYRRVLGDDHSLTIISLNNHALVLDSLGRAAEAEPLWKEALDRSRRVQGVDHPDTILLLNNYAAVLESLGRATESEPVVKEALERSRRVLGEDHPLTVISLNTYSHVLRAQGKSREAEPLLKEALALRQRALGVDHPDTILSLHNYAAVLTSLGQWADSEPFAREAVSRAVKNMSVGKQHPNTKRFAQTHADNLDALGRHAEAEALRKEFGLPQPRPEPTTRE
ncbi:MAG: tetratricopeptide repeat protein [Tepidisphaeraceae bacterium]